MFLTQMVKMLLEKGATINAFDKKDRRAIHWAAYMGHVDVVKTLTDHGAEINCRDKQVRYKGSFNISSGLTMFKDLDGWVV